jgi:hypothetical protein
MFRQFKEKDKNMLRLKLKSALKIEQISVVFSTNTTDHHDITELLLKVSFKTIAPTPNSR